MKPSESFVAQPVRSLQTMLRSIARMEPEQLSPVPDGVYGEQTAQAVRSFQRRVGLPVTGVADNATWDRIVEDYRRALIQADKAQTVQITLDPGQVIRRGEAHPYVGLVQAMLILLAEVYEAFPELVYTGVLDAQTQQALLALQLRAGLPPTGELDKQTWKNLALHYAQAAALAQEPEKV